MPDYIPPYWDTGSTTNVNLNLLTAFQPDRPPGDHAYVPDSGDTNAKLPYHTEQDNIDYHHRKELNPYVAVGDGSFDDSITNNYGIPWKADQGTGRLWNNFFDQNYAIQESDWDTNSDFYHYLFGQYLSTFVKEFLPAVVKVSKLNYQQLVDTQSAACDDNPLCAQSKKDMKYLHRLFPNYLGLIVNPGEKQTNATYTELQTILAKAMKACYNKDITWQSTAVISSDIPDGAPTVTNNTEAWTASTKLGTTQSSSTIKTTTTVNTTADTTDSSKVIVKTTITTIPPTVPPATPTTTNPTKTSATPLGDVTTTVSVTAQTTVTTALNKTDDTKVDINTSVLKFTETTQKTDSATTVTKTDHIKIGAVITKNASTIHNNSSLTDDKGKVIGYLLSETTTTTATTVTTTVNEANDKKADIATSVLTTTAKELTYTPESQIPAYMTNYATKQVIVGDDFQEISDDEINTCLQRWFLGVDPTSTDPGKPDTTMYLSTPDSLDNVWKYFMQASDIEMRGKRGLVWAYSVMISVLDALQIVAEVQSQRVSTLTTAQKSATSAMIKITVPEMKSAKNFTAITDKKISQSETSVYRASREMVQSYTHQQSNSANISNQFYQNQTTMITSLIQTIDSLIRFVLRR
jgi:hypothetical protein